MEFHTLSKTVLDATMREHSELGPGLFEETYKACLKHELLEAKVGVFSEVALPVKYRGVVLALHYRADPQ